MSRGESADVNRIWCDDGLDPLCGEQGGILGRYSQNRIGRAQRRPFQVPHQPAKQRKAGQLFGQDVMGCQDNLAAGSVRGRQDDTGPERIFKHDDIRPRDNRSQPAAQSEIDPRPQEFPAQPNHPFARQAVSTNQWNA